MHAISQKRVREKKIFHLSAGSARLTYFTVYVPKTIFPGRDIPKMCTIAKTLLRLTRNKKLIFDGGERKNRERIVSGRATKNRAPGAQSR